MADERRVKVFAGLLGLTSFLRVLPVSNVICGASGCTNYGITLEAPVSILQYGLYFRAPVSWGVSDATFYRRVSPLTVVAFAGWVFGCWWLAGRLHRGHFDRLRRPFRVDRVAAVVFGVGMLSAVPALVPLLPGGPGTLHPSTAVFGPLEGVLEPLSHLSGGVGLVGILGTIVTGTPIRGAVGEYGASPLGVLTYMVWWALFVEMVFWAGVATVSATVVHRVRQSVARWRSAPS